MTAAAVNAPANPPSSPLPVLHLTYEGIHQQISDAVEGPRAIFSAWSPTLLLAISGGGLIPTRILRSCFRRVQQREADAQGRDPSAVPNVAVQCVGLQLYDTEGLDPETSAPIRTQWIRHEPEAAARQALDDWEQRRRQQRGGESPAAAAASAAAAAAARPLVLQGQRVLVVDEVDDSRATLAACCAELEADARRERDAYEELRRGCSPGPDGAHPPPFEPMQLGVFVVYNKRRPKRGALSDDIVMSGRYFATCYVPNCWIRFPWDAEDIAAHAEAAKRQQAAVRVLPPADGDEQRQEREQQREREQRARRRTDAAAPEILLP